MWSVLFLLMSVLLQDLLDVKNLGSLKMWVECYETIYMWVFTNTFAYIKWNLFCRYKEIQSMCVVRLLNVG